MLTILIENRNNEAELAHTLAALVAGAVEGLVSDVIILDNGSTDGSAHVADTAGARFCTGWAISDVILSARGSWFLLLEPGARPVGRWVDDIAEYMAIGTKPARFSASRLYQAPLLKRMTRRRSKLELGHLMTRQQASKAASEKARLGDLVTTRLVHRLGSEIVPAWVTIGNRPVADRRK